MSTQEIISKAHELKEYMRMKEDIEATIAGLQDEIKAVMTEQRAEELTAGEYKIRYKAVKSARFDSKAFKATHADLYSQYSNETVSKRFTIS